MFNHALLAKQALRLLTNSEPFFHNVCKACYFLMGDIPTARIGNNPSCAWRSIRGAVGMLKLGLRLQVGSGNSITIGNDIYEDS